jgi:hypothetical protein
MAAIRVRARYALRLGGHRPRAMRPARELDTTMIPTKPPTRNQLEFEVDSATQARPSHLLLRPADAVAPADDSEPEAAAAADQVRIDSTTRISSQHQTESDSESDFKSVPGPISATPGHVTVDPDRHSHVAEYWQADSTRISSKSLTGAVSAGRPGRTRRCRLVTSLMGN